ncbi:GGDEF domain-containing protein [Guyparkeria hydrothermalis]|uniref:GGDEF domain-containing protein n=1 Tax=Guyparkeria hydrothermalis TaxID=923 RepID=UPI0020224B44|nr:GGDEF domain-containing protein [Guyparkeria hydrothermalis]MCL7745407.1 GGDEF domain-containing protein [Guyparkeria hydrothermalis]
MTLTTATTISQKGFGMACYLNTDESYGDPAASGPERGSACCYPATPGATPEEWNERGAALLRSLVRCVSVAVALDSIREHLEVFLSITSISWQLGEERYCCNEANPSEHTIPIALSLDDGSFGRLLLHSRYPVENFDLGPLRRMLAVVAYPLRNLRMLEHALIAAEHDALTGLKNRRAFDMDLQEVHARFQRYGGQASLLLLDMSRFKSINDTYGHDVGDRALTRVAEGLDRCLRQTDSAYRLGGDEFAVILPETPYHGARRLAARLIEWLQEYPLRDTGDEIIPLRASIGMAQWREDEDRDEWFRRADQALYGRHGDHAGGEPLGRLA